MNILRSCSRIIIRTQNLNAVNSIGKRYIKPWVHPTMIEISRRKKDIERNTGTPIKDSPRNTFIEWNYEAEIFAFNARLKEKFNVDLLTKALTHSSYLFQEECYQKKLGIENPQLSIEDNKRLVELGNMLTSKTVESYMSLALPRAPEECIIAIHDYLLSDKILGHSSSLIGTKDIILTAEYPPSDKTLAETFLALVGALAKSVDEVHAAIFVRDFLIAPLAEKDLSEIWNPEDPAQILNDILIRDGRKPFEPRIIAQSGVNSLIPIYKIGLYSNKEFISSGTEDNINDAIKVAALNALHNMFGIAESSAPIKFNLVVNPSSDTMKNLPLKLWSTQNINKLLQQSQVKL